MANFLQRGRALARLAVRAAWHGIEGFYRSDNLTYAASIAYYAMLSLFPLFLLAFTLLGRAAADPQDRNAVFEFALRYFPANFEFITTQLDAFRANTVTFGVAGTVALVWGALGVFGAITTAVNASTDRSPPSSCSSCGSTYRPSSFCTGLSSPWSTHA